MKKTRACGPVTVGDTTIVPLEHVVSRSWAIGNGFLAYLCKEPVGVVVISPRGTWAVTAAGEDLPLSTAVQEVQGLREILGGFDQSGSQFEPRRE